MVCVRRWLISTSVKVFWLKISPCYVLLSGSSILCYRRISPFVAYILTITVPMAMDVILSHVTASSSKTATLTLVTTVSPLRADATTMAARVVRASLPDSLRRTSSFVTVSLIMVMVVLLSVQRFLEVVRTSMPRIARWTLLRSTVYYVSRRTHVVAVSLRTSTCATLPLVSVARLFSSSILTMSLVRSAAVASIRQSAMLRWRMSLVRNQSTAWW